MYFSFSFPLLLSYCIHTPAFIPPSTPLRPPHTHIHTHTPGCAYLEPGWRSDPYKNKRRRWMLKFHQPRALFQEVFVWSSWDTACGFKFPRLFIYDSPKKGVQTHFFALCNQLCGLYGFTSALCFRGPSLRQFYYIYFAYTPPPPHPPPPALPAPTHKKEWAISHSTVPLG